MQFKDLSYWGIFKLSLIFEIIIPIILAPFILVLYLTNPEATTAISLEPRSVMGLLIESDSFGLTLLLGLILLFISLIVQSALWYFLAQKTPLGRVKISNKIIAETKCD